MIAARLAARRLARAPRRVLLTVALGAGGLAAAMVVANLARGVYDRAVADAARSGPGHLTVLPAAAPGPAAEAPEFADEGLLARLAALPGVEAALPRRGSPALATRAGRTRAAVLAGVDLAREAASSPALRGEGSGAVAPPGPRDAIVAAALATQLGLRAGDALDLTVPAPTGAVRTARVRVARVLDPALDALEDAVVYVDAGVVQEAAAAPGRLHAAAVLLRPASPAATRRTEAAVRALAAGRPGLRVATWRETLPTLRDAIALDRLGHRLLLAAVAAVVALGAAVAVATSLLARTREHGLLLALGAPPGLLRRTVLAEGAVLGAAAVALGLAAGAAATVALARWGLDVRPLFGAEVAYGGVLVPLRVYAGWDGAETAAAAAAIFAAYAAAALATARAATRGAPADALRHR